MGFIEFPRPLNVISEGQDFTGIIHTTERYADMIIAAKNFRLRKPIP